MPIIMVSSTRKAIIYSRTRWVIAFQLASTARGVRKVDNKSKLQLLTGAQKAVERASKIVEALKDTPTEVEENGDTRKKAKGMKRKGEEKGVKKAEKEKPKKKSKVEKAEDKPKDDKKAAKKEKKKKKKK